MTTFADLGLSDSALKAVRRLGYENPTPVQEQAIPYVLEGRDLIAAASTGTGKTAAFLLPILSTLPRAGRGKRPPRVLVVTPTRELAQQISLCCIKVARATGHFTTTLYGGSAYGPQIRELRCGTDVVIATPGRLNDLMDRGVADLSHIEVLVLDEADRMLDMGFLPAVTKIVAATPHERQTLLFSATIDQSIENNLGSLLRDPAVVQIAKKGETADTVEQFIMPVATRNKAELLRATLTEKGAERVIVFVRTRNRTEECAKMLRGAGFAAESIHSDKSQAKRRRALEDFRKGKVGVLVATDVLARGIDVREVNYVINYDLPDAAQDYIHRIGRTGRAGEAGYAISFVSPDTRRLLREIERLTKHEIPVMELESYELDLTLLKKSRASVRKSATELTRTQKKAEAGVKTATKHKNAQPNQVHAYKKADDYFTEHKQKHPQKHTQTSTSTQQKRRPKKTSDVRAFGERKVSHKQHLYEEDEHTENRRLGTERSDNNRAVNNRAVNNRAVNNRAVNKRTDSKRQADRRSNSKRTDSKRQADRRSDSRQQTNKRNSKKQTTGKRTSTKHSSSKHPSAKRPSAKHSNNKHGKRK